MLHGVAHYLRWDSSPPACKRMYGGGQNVSPHASVRTHDVIAHELRKRRMSHPKAVLAQLLPRKVDGREERSC